MVDKPAGMTSHDVVNIARRSLQTKTIGHTGTLDKPATGLVALLVGRATKLSPFLTDMDKTYEGIIAFGIETTTDDAAGEVVSRKACDKLGREELQGIINKYTGNLKQKAPRYSAIQVGGQKLYKLAVSGVQFDQPVRDIFIYENRLLGFKKDDHPEARIFVSCSKGTYIRALARDIGQETGCGAHLKELRRLSIGNMSVSEAVSLDTLKESPSSGIFSKLIPMERALAKFPTLSLKSGMEADVMSGKKLLKSLFDNTVEAGKGQTIVVLDSKKRLVAIVEAEQELDWDEERPGLKYRRVIETQNDIG